LVSDDCTTARLSSWLLAAGCGLPAGDWLLAAGGWRLAAGCWLLAAGGWRLAAARLSSWRLAAVRLALTAALLVAHQTFPKS
jgi:hypothetical protein